jgi:hypothetical protein
MIKDSEIMKKESKKKNCQTNKSEQKMNEN